LRTAAGREVDAIAAIVDLNDIVAGTFTAHARARPTIWVTFNAAMS
jgi:hypothetical protein